MALAQECAPLVHPLTVGYLVAGESSNNPYAINVNYGGPQLVRQPRNLDEAQATVDWLERHGANFDVGLGQVNSANFRRLGLTGGALLDPCTNLRASQAVLADCYAMAAKAVGQGQKALLRAVSCYNTGSQRRGFENGYVRRFVSLAEAYPVPALSGAGVATANDLLVSGPNSGSRQDKKSRITDGRDTSSAPVGGGDDGADDGAFSDADPGAFGEARKEPP